MSLRTLPLLELNADQANRVSGSQSVAAVEARPRTSHQPLVVLAILTIATLMAAVATRVSAQPPQKFAYDSIPIPGALNDEATVKKVASVTQRFASTGQGNASWARGYLSVYVPAKMTAPDGIKHITELVDDTRTMLTRAERSRPQVALALTKYVFDGMKKVAEGNYHPAARINAILVLSELNQRPADNQQRRPPIPLVQQVLPILMNIYQDESNVDGVRAAALQGMQRHAQLGFPLITGNTRTQIIAEMNKLLDSDPPARRSSDAHAYLKRFAVDILTSLRSQQDSDLGTKLVSLSTDNSNPDLIALYSASRLASMGADMKGKIGEPEPILRSWAKRALAAFEAELARIEALERPKSVTSQPTKPEQFLQKVSTKPKEKAAGAMSMDSMYGMEGMDDMEGMDGEDEMMEDMMDMMGGMEMDMMGMMGGIAEAKPQPPVVIAARRKINHALQQIHLGVTGNASAGMPSRKVGGLLASVDDDKRQAVTDWVNEFQPIVEAINDETLDDQTKFVDGLTEQIEALKRFIGDDPVQEQPLLPADPQDPAAADPAAADPADASAAASVPGPAESLGS